MAWWTREQAAKQVGVSARTLKRLEEQGLGPPVTKFGKRSAYNDASTMAWLAGRGDR